MTYEEEQEQMLIDMQRWCTNVVLLLTICCVVLMFAFTGMLLVLGWRTLWG